jgi:hypothetical protein
MKPANEMLKNANGVRQNGAAAANDYPIPTESKISNVAASHDRLAGRPRVLRKSAAGHVSHGIRRTTPSR